jgi:uncharacterized glyoxalase superfamily metalloenzyme YdcJ
MLIIGHELYQKLMGQVSTRETQCSKITNNGHQGLLEDAFLAFPDTWEELRTAGLVYFEYFVSGQGEGSDLGLDELIQNGTVKYRPVIYEDFLPASAAGIFQSNIGENGFTFGVSGPSKVELEDALGQGVIDSQTHYAERERLSIEEVFRDIRGWP